MHEHKKYSYLSVPMNMVLCADLSQASDDPLSVASLCVWIVTAFVFLYTAHPFTVFGCFEISVRLILEVDVFVACFGLGFSVSYMRQLCMQM